jgi:hypothetical protein
MVSPTPPPVTDQPATQPVPEPALSGPYTAAVNGRCAAGHALNAEGRCNELNTGIEVQAAAIVAP